MSFSDFGAPNVAPTAVRFMNSGEVGFCTNLPVSKKSKAIWPRMEFAQVQMLIKFFLYYTTFFFKSDPLILFIYFWLCWVFVADMGFL